MSKDNTFNEMDSEFLLTRIVQRAGSAYEVSLDDISQDSRSQDVTIIHQGVLGYERISIMRIAEMDVDESRSNHL